MRFTSVSGAAFSRFLRTGLVVLLMGASAAACSDSGDRHEKLAIDGDMPFAAFLGDDLGIIDYAQLKMRNQCLAEAGYPQDLNIMLPEARNPFPSLVITARTFGPTSEEEARRIGFGRDSRPAPPSIASFDSAYDKTSEECDQKAWRKLPASTKEAYQQYYDLGNQLGLPFFKTIDERMRGGWQKLLTCLGKKGYHASREEEFLKSPEPGLFGVQAGGEPTDPADDWNPKGTPGTVEVGPARPARQYHAAPAEGALAVAWFHCRQETGIDKEEMNTALQVQRELVVKYEVSFTELNPRIEAATREAVRLTAARQ
jgi:hypothetical protein